MLFASPSNFLSKENQERANSQLEKVKGTFLDSNPIILILSINVKTTEERSPQITWQPHFSVCLIVLSVFALISSYLS